MVYAIFSFFSISIVLSDGLRYSIIIDKIMNFGFIFGNIYWVSIYYFRQNIVIYVRISNRFDVK